MSVSIGNFKNSAQFAAFTIFLGVFAGSQFLSSALMAQATISASLGTLLSGSGSGVTGSLTGAQEDGFVDLFNGKNLSIFYKMNLVLIY